MKADKASSRISLLERPLRTGCDTCNSAQSLAIATAPAPARDTRYVPLCCSARTNEENASAVPKGRGRVRPTSAWPWREKSDNVIDVISLDGGPPGHDISRHQRCRPCWTLRDESRTPRRGSAQCPDRGMRRTLRSAWPERLGTKQGPYLSDKRIVQRPRNVSAKGL